MPTQLPDEIREALTFWGKASSWMIRGVHQDEISKTDPKRHEARALLLATCLEDLEKRIGALRRYIDTRHPELLCYWPELPTTDTTVERAESLGHAMRQIAARIFERVKAAETATSPTKLPKLTKGTKLANAIATLYLHADWTDARIAVEVGCTPEYLSRNAKYQAARGAIKAIGWERLNRAKKGRGRDRDEEA